MDLLKENSDVKKRPATHGAFGGSGLYTDGRLVSDQNKKINGLRPHFRMNLFKDPPTKYTQFSSL